MKCLFLAGIIVFNLTIIYARINTKKQSDNHYIQERNDYPGLSQMLKVTSEVIESLLAFLAGNGSIDDVTNSIEGFLSEFSRLISLQGLLGQIPVVGFILQPIVGMIATVMSHTPLLGGIISFVLVGLGN
ncbi:uncharacterized protein LOC130450313 [Diorhabda sublineata]|uniref:uncharacterized protein LOC130450313 n=1 Tax=Diorhabda sublineata TaxID=1163346 RepID=UPI0024E17E62|nr:uncharacterized protein LOC130450313 [Diorhabda sublineata]